MNEDRVDELLREIGRERMTPPAELVQRIERRANADRLLAAVTAAGLVLSALWVVPLVLIWWLPGWSWTVKVAGYAGASLLSSVAMLLLLAGREPVGRLLIAADERLRF